MQFISIKVRGLGPFASLVEHNISTLDGRLSVVSGPNGRGKSTLLELLLGAVYRKTPTRGTLVELAGEHRDGLLEVVVKSDRVYTLKHVVDGVSGKAEAVVSVGGQPLTQTGKVTEFDEEVAKHFPPLAIALTTQFAAQQSGGFLDAKPAERKTLLLKMLGVDQLEQLAHAGRERTRAAKAEQESRERLLTVTMAADTPRTGDATLALVQRNEEKATSEQQAIFASKQLEEGRDFNQSIEARRAEELSRQKAASAILASLESARAEIRALATPDAATRALLDQEQPIRDAQGALEGLVERGQELAQVATELQGKVDALTAGKKALATSIEQLLDRQCHARALSEQHDKVTAAAATVEASQLEAARLRVVLEAAELELKNAQAETLTDAAGRIEGLRAGLDKVCTGLLIRAVDTAERTLLHDDQAVELAGSLPARIRSATEAAHVVKVDLSKVEKAEREAVALASRRDAVVAAKAEAEALKEQLVGLEGELRQANESIEKATEAALSSAAERNRARELYVAAKQIASMGDRLNQALQDRAAAGAKQDHLDARILDLLAEQQALPPALHSSVQALELRDVRKLQTQVDQAQGQAAQAEAAVALALKALADAEARDKLAKQQADEATKARQIAEDWCKLSKDLGKDGLQAAVIDAALPELIAITNQLLGDAFGPRFAVDIRSQSMAASGKKMVETLDVLVIDSEQGREARSETYSGGERAIIAEGLSLALTTLACRQSGIANPTIVRDEAGAALDELRGRQWVAMLRQAAELIGASRVLFVSHDPGCRALADSEVAL